LGDIKWVEVPSADLRLTGTLPETFYFKLGCWFGEWVVGGGPHADFLAGLYANFVVGAKITQIFGDRE
jgi:hypothetical protein